MRSEGDHGQLLCADKPRSNRILYSNPKCRCHLNYQWRGKNNYTFTVDSQLGFVYIWRMKNKALILKAAKRFLRLRMKAAGTYTYYASAGMCLYGPHGGASYWGDYREWEQACKDCGLEFVQYSDAADSGLVMKKARELSSRYTRFCDAVHQWKEIGQKSYGDNSVESIQQDRFGKLREVLIMAPGGDVCF